jgi:hypothetical protein
MNLEEIILKEHSKKQCNKIVQWVGNNPERFNELFHLFLNTAINFVLTSIVSLQKKNMLYSSSTRLSTIFFVMREISSL